MPLSMNQQAMAAQEAIRALERALMSSQSQWADDTRQAFDRQHAQDVVAAGHKVAEELAALARELSTALTLLQD